MRGQIQYRNRSLQVRDYSGLRYKNITPTDIDGFFEIQNKVFLFIELKFGDTPLPYGQQLALERLVDAINKPALLIIAVHDYPSHIDIDGANCIVDKFRYNNKWFIEPEIHTVKNVIDRFLLNQGFEDYVL